MDTREQAYYTNFSVMLGIGIGGLLAFVFSPFVIIGAAIVAATVTVFTHVIRQKKSVGKR